MLPDILWGTSGPELRATALGARLCPAAHSAMGSRYPVQNTEDPEAEHREAGQEESELSDTFLPP